MGFATARDGAQICFKDWGEGSPARVTA